MTGLAGLDLGQRPVSPGELKFLRSRSLGLPVLAISLIRIGPWNVGDIKSGLDALD